jgi:hypothetical protein
MNTSSMTTTPLASVGSPIPKLPPVDCTGWCTSEDGHADASHPDDQYCISDDEQIYLTAEKLVEYDKGRYGLGSLETYLSREAYSTRTLFRVSHNEGVEGNITLTRDEAMALRDALDKLLAADELERS